jgi:hypothetical protein
MLATNFNGEGIHDRRVFESLESLGHRPLQDNIERVPVVSGRKDLWSRSIRIMKLPRLLIEFGLA